MGAVSSRTPNSSRKISPNVILNEKESDFLILQNEFDNAIKNKDKNVLDNTRIQILSHIKDLKQFDDRPTYGTEIAERTQRLMYNYEILLAQVRSIFSTLPNNKITRNIESSEVSQTLGNSTCIEENISVLSDRESPDNNLNEMNSENKTIWQTLGEDTDHLNCSVSSSVTEHAIGIDEKCEDVHDDLEKYMMLRTESQLIDPSNYEEESLYMNISNLKHIADAKEKAILESNQIIHSNKPPLPVPRNKEEILVKEVPKYFERLNEILEKTHIDNRDIEEVLMIKKKTNNVKNIFIGKIDNICKRYEANLRERLKNETV